MITKIWWRRTYLCIEYEASALPSLECGGSRFLFTPETEEERNKWGEEAPLPGRNRAFLNIAYTDGSGFLEEGQWVLEGATSEGEVPNAPAGAISNAEGRAIPNATDEAIADLVNLDRVFRYDGKNAYVATFAYDERRERIVLCTEFMTHNKNPKKRGFAKGAYKAGVNAFYRIAGLFAPKKPGVLFLSETKDVMSDNFLAVYNEMLERELDRKYTIRTYLQNEVAGGKTGHLRMVRDIAKSKVIFVDDYMPVFSFLKLKRDVQLVQLWHAGFGYKLVGYARFGREGSPHPYDSCHRAYTAAVVGNEELKETYAEVFGIDKEKLIPTGMPRLSDFPDEAKAREVRETLAAKYPSIRGKRVILFAPTYRGYNQKEAHYDFSKIDQGALRCLCEETNSVVLFKWHPFVREGIVIESGTDAGKAEPLQGAFPEDAGKAEPRQDVLLDLSDENILDLFYISDVLVTDYSSCFYDFLLLDKPVAFYVYDEAHYGATRGMHYPVSATAPGPVCHSFEELLEVLRNDRIPMKEIPAYMKDRRGETGPGETAGTGDSMEAGETAAAKVVTAVFGKEIGPM